MHIKHGCTSTPLLLWLTVITFSMLYNNIAGIEIPTRFLYKRSADADTTAETADAGERVRTDGTSDEVSEMRKESEVIIHIHIQNCMNI